MLKSLEDSIQWRRKIGWAPRHFRGLLVFMREITLLSCAKNYGGAPAPGAPTSYTTAIDSISLIYDLCQAKVSSMGNEGWKSEGRNWGKKIQVEELV